MPSVSSLSELTLTAFLTRVADADPVPASGCVAALQGALGCALSSMAFRHASGESAEGKRQPVYMGGRADELSELAERLLALVQEDAQAYGAFADAAHDEARDKAARAALEVPLEVAETALAGLRLLAVGADGVPAPLWSEVLVACNALAAAIDGGLALVRANAGSIDDADWTADRLAILDTLASQADALAAEVRGVRADAPNVGGTQEG